MTPVLAVVVPEAAAGRRAQALLALVEWLAGELDRPPTVVCWQTGPLVGAFQAIAPVIDAGAINDRAATRALATVGLTGLARPLKSVQLRRALAPLAECDRLVLGGADADAVLEWLAPREDRRVTRWPNDREPIVEPAMAPPLARAGRTVAILGTGPDPAATLAAIIAVIAAAGSHPDANVTLVHADVRGGWRRWTDPQFAGLEAVLSDRRTADCRDRMDDLAALVVLGPVDDPLATRAALRGVPVLSLDTSSEPVAHAQQGPVALAERLTTLLMDPDAWGRASTDAVALAEHHLVDHAGRAVLQALDRPSR